MKIIELSVDKEKCFDSNFSGTLLVNLDQICTIIEERNGTKVTLSNGDCLIVHESYKEIQDKIKATCVCLKKGNDCRWSDNQGNCWFFMPDSKLPCNGSDKCKYYEKGIGVHS